MPRRERARRTWNSIACACRLSSLNPVNTQLVLRGSISALVAQEATINLDERFLLTRREAQVGANRGLHAGPVGLEALVAEPARDRIKLLRSDAQSLGDRLQDIRRRLVEAALDLTQVWLRDASQIRELA